MAKKTVEIATKKYVDDNTLSKVNPTGTGSFSLNRKADTTIGTNSTAEGNNTTASGNWSHAEGAGTTASGTGSHTEGTNTTASKNNSHAEGSVTTASGVNSHAEGIGTTASGNNSHAEGQSTTALNSSEHASGSFNISHTGDTSSTQTLFSIGNGSSTTNPSNAFEVYKDGHAEIGKMGVTSTSIATREWVNNSLTQRLEATKQAISDVGGLVLPDTAPTVEKLVAIDTNNAQKLIDVPSEGSKLYRTELNPILLNLTLLNYGQCF